MQSTRLKSNLQVLKNGEHTCTQMNKLIKFVQISHCFNRRDEKDYRFEDDEFVPLLAGELDGSVGSCLRAVGIVRCLARKD